ncbi:hypothetical protein IM697_38455 [Streptomyces ferrugineus]|uniref:Helix-turn-helix type 11 domain-containing protein n=1 Tax=Streptomyces ferrugineus TaxID=1413221 RepID=A0A7M2SJF2_9ACTN|nr:hypothetical protein [Streptomyces ferrugineus]QOV35865.1 hypothetical protein IM697_38455 [Streptomyces ferrugineus]
MPDRNGTHTGTGRRHQAQLLELLRRHGPLSRRGLQNLSGLSRTTVYDEVTKLVAEGAVVIGGAPLAWRGRGRPVELLTLGTGTPDDEGDRES